MVCCICDIVITGAFTWSLIAWSAVIFAWIISFPVVLLGKRGSLGAVSYTHLEYAFRDIYLLTASAEQEDSAADGAVRGLEGWISCFERARLAGVVRGGGADAPGEMARLTDCLFYTSRCV